MNTIYIHIEIFIINIISIFKKKNLNSKKTKIRNNFKMINTKFIIQKILINKKKI